MTDKRILLISLRSDLSGGPRHVEQVSRYLKNHFSLYLATPLDPPFGQKFQTLAKEHFKLTHRRFSWSTFFSLLKFCQDRRISLVHSHGRGAGIYSRCLSFFGIKVIHTYHGIHREKNFSDRVKNFVDRILSLRNSYNLFISKDEFQMAGINRYNLGSYSIVSNGVEIPESAMTISDKVPNPLIMGTLTRLDPHKGNQWLIQALSKICFSNFRLKIAGVATAEEKSTFVQAIQKLGLAEKIEFVGEVQDPLSFLRDLDLYISASYGEGLPYSLLEAMSLGLPVLASKVSGHNQLLNPECLFEHNSESLEEKLTNFTNNPALLKGQGRDNRNKVIQNYSFDHQMEQLLKIYLSYF